MTSYKETLHTTNTKPSEIQSSIKDGQSLSRAKFGELQIDFHKNDPQGSEEKKYFSAYRIYCKMSLFLIVLSFWLPIFYFLIVKGSSTKELLGNSFTYVSISLIGLIPLGNKI